MSCFCDGIYQMRQSQLDHLQSTKPHLSSAQAKASDERGQTQSVALGLVLLSQMHLYTASFLRMRDGDVFVASPVCSLAAKWKHGGSVFGCDTKQLWGLWQ